MSFNERENRIATEVMRRCAEKLTELWDLLDLYELDDHGQTGVLSDVIHRLVETRQLDRAMTPRGAVFTVRVSGVDIDAVHRNPRWTQVR